MAQNNKPIRQHYIPKFYLKGFTKSGKETDCLHVIEQKTGKQYKARPSELAVQKDIYTLDTDYDDEVKYGVENILSIVESDVASIIPQIIKNEELPSGKNYDLLMEFIAIMESRVPRGIGRTKRLYDQTVRLIGKFLTANKKKFNAQMNVLRESGESIENVSYEKVRELVDSGTYDVTVDQNTLMKHFIEAVNTIYPSLRARTWSIYKISMSEHYFICSDHPVFLGWTTLPEGKWMQHAPGHELKNTHVTFPLNKEYAIRGVFEGESGIIQCSDEQIALINSQVACRADRIYSCRQDFVWRDCNGNLCNIEHLKKIRVNKNIK